MVRGNVSTVAVISINCFSRKIQSQMDPINGPFLEVREDSSFSEKVRWFDSPLILLAQESEEKRRVNEVTLEGEGDFAIEFGHNNAFLLRSTLPCTVWRVFSNRLSVNFVPSIEYIVDKLDKPHVVHGVSYVGHLYDADLPWTTSTGKVYGSLQQAHRDMRERTNTYRQEVYGTPTFRATEWVITGDLEIAFINRRHTGKLSLLNRTPLPKSIQMGGVKHLSPSLLRIQPFQSVLIEEEEEEEEEKCQ